MIFLFFHEIERRVPYPLTYPLHPTRPHTPVLSPSLVSSRRLLHPSPPLPSSFPRCSDHPSGARRPPLPPVVAEPREATPSPGTRGRRPPRPATAVGAAPLPTAGLRPRALRVAAAAAVTYLERRTKAGPPPLHWTTASRPRSQPPRRWTGPGGGRSPRGA
ncbi:unnamed protein product [Ectocarpus sp. 8 AP-2014]